jgi:hypothetical protein
MEVDDVLSPVLATGSGRIYVFLITYPQPEQAVEGPF